MVSKEPSLDWISGRGGGCIAIISALKRMRQQCRRSRANQRHVSGRRRMYFGAREKNLSHSVSLEQMNKLPVTMRPAEFNGAVASLNT